MVLDPELVALVLTDSAGFQKTMRRHKIRYLVGDGSGTGRKHDQRTMLFTHSQNPEEFRRARREKLRPAFQAKLLPEQTATMARSAERVLNRWKSGEPRDVLADCFALSLDAACRTFFGLQPTEALHEAMAVKLATSPAIARRMRTYFLPERRATDLGAVRPWALSFTRDGQAMARRRRVLADWPDLLKASIPAREGIAGPTLQQLLANFDAGRSTAGPPDDVGGPSLFPNTSIGLFSAAYENTATTLAWALWLLASHPHVQSRVEAEVGERRLTYLEAVCAETLRLYPPVWSTIRESVREVEHGNIVLPAGSLLVLSPWIQHRQPWHWSTPNQFDPNRFYTPAIPVTRGTYYPFATGPAMCPGRRAALDGLVAILDLVMQRFRLEAVARLPAPEPLLANVQYPHPYCWIRPFHRP
jgi:cytochrome P450